ncbi:MULTISPECIES: hypothetical protein [Lysinibacillus]|uniref:hypothetical protein n=1 Tax=Lysinibacillus TaxID=400634 RepID=UPI00214BEB44|nr:MULTISPECIES: hypothetical protein [Lysinibacillus]UUV23433.1 hypothetical protein NP781_16325 [Lysinibacillus sp. FN11]UYB46303.1 hypothetical protein OCI51_18935 [Lysinibacillus capsici]
MTTKTNTNSAIGKDISKIPNRHKPYFKVDSDNKIIGYKRNIGIDKLILKARFTKEEIEDLTSQFISYDQHESLPNGYTLVYHIVDLREPYGVYIKLLPFEDGVNTEIQLHSKFTTNLIGNSPVILDILNNPKWFIVRLDVATDYVTPFNTSAYLRTHGNKKQTNFETSSWAGSMGNPNKKACDSHYDRKAKDEMLEDNFINRFEVKLFFKESDGMKLYDLNHDEIIARLQKEMFIPCLTYSYFHDKQVKTNRGQKEYIDLIKQAKGADCENTIKPHLTDAQWKTFRKHFKESRDDIEQAYIDVQDFMYDFLKAQH